MLRQLDARRTAAPQTSPRRPQAAASSYGEAKFGYLMNRAHAYGDDNLLHRLPLDLSAH
jgi:hypothetical protein